MKSAISFFYDGQYMHYDGHCHISFNTKNGLKLVNLPSCMLLEEPDKDESYNDAYVIRVLKMYMDTILSEKDWRLNKICTIDDEGGVCTGLS
ncbi:MAG: hypothetical protein KAS32_16280 [Candidatus Peribacteraceae bacterium]|nr:hypothetical protein [Candidatus Peribacteraceae bacterium]